MGTHRQIPEDELLTQAQFEVEIVSSKFQVSIARFRANLRAQTILIALNRRILASKCAQSEAFQTDPRVAANTVSRQQWVSGLLFDPDSTISLLYTLELIYLPTLPPPCFYPAKNARPELSRSSFKIFDE